MNAYKILQVDTEAEAEMIDAAYRRLAWKYHPDKDSSPSAATKMKEINAAYEVLRNPARRAEYDRQSRRSATRPEPASPDRPSRSATVVQRRTQGTANASYILGRCLGWLLRALRSKAGKVSLVVVIVALWLAQTWARNGDHSAYVQPDVPLVSPPASATPPATDLVPIPSVEVGAAPDPALGSETPPKSSALLAPPDVRGLVKKAREAIQGETDEERQTEKDALQELRKAQTNKVFGCYNECLMCGVKCGPDEACEAACFKESSKCCRAAGAIPNAKCGCEK